MKVGKKSASELDESYVGLYNGRGDDEGWKKTTLNRKWTWRDGVIGRDPQWMICQKWPDSLRKRAVVQRQNEVHTQAPGLSASPKNLAVLDMPKMVIRLSRQL
ncbi:hypothetical protein B0H13DRAFT_1880894 [Mycena leptocephala]|nr:hypothetical protein B0H13DRAFT_1880894 [Mycena leptocephala]